MEQPAFTKSRTPAGEGSPYTEGTLCFAILQGLSGVARELLSAGAVPPQTPRDLRSQTGFAGRLRAGLPLRSNVVGTYGSPTNAPSFLYDTCAMID